MRRFTERCVFSFIVLWLVASCVEFSHAQARRRKIKKPAALTGCSASFKAPKPNINRTPAKTAQGHLISDCEPVNLKTVYQPQLAYPKIARAAKVAGVVKVEVVIDEEGKVIWTNVVEGHPLLRAAALRGACQTRIEPAVDCIGRRLKTNTILYFNFNPEK